MRRTDGTDDNGRLVGGESVSHMAKLGKSNTRLGVHLFLFNCTAVTAVSALGSCLGGPK